MTGDSARCGGDHGQVALVYQLFIRGTPEQAGVGRATQLRSTPTTTPLRPATRATVVRYIAARPSPARKRARCPRAQRRVPGSAVRARAARPEPMAGRTHQSGDLVTQVRPSPHPLSPAATRAAQKSATSRGAWR